MHHERVENKSYSCEYKQTRKKYKKNTNRCIAICLVSGTNSTPKSELVTAHTHFHSLKNATHFRRETSLSSTPQTSHLHVYSFVLWSTIMRKVSLCSTWLTPLPSYVYFLVHIKKNKHNKKVFLWENSLSQRVLRIIGLSLVCKKKAETVGGRLGFSFRWGF